MTRFIIHLNINGLNLLNLILSIQTIFSFEMTYALYSSISKSGIPNSATQLH